MGNSQIPRVNHSQVVVVGGSFAGLSVIEHLKDKFSNIVLIDKNDYFEYLCTNLRALV
jgi:NADH dehydrogenase FAD-containing subunit